MAAHLLRVLFWWGFSLQPLLCFEGLSVAHLLFQNCNDCLQCIYQLTAFENLWSLLSRCSHSQWFVSCGFCIYWNSPCLCFSVSGGRNASGVSPRSGLQIYYCNHWKCPFRYVFTGWEGGWLRISGKFICPFVLCLKLCLNSTGDLAADETQLLTSKLASEKHLCFISELTNWALQR